MEVVRQPDLLVGCMRISVAVAGSQMTGHNLQCRSRSTGRSDKIDANHARLRPGDERQPARHILGPHPETLHPALASVNPTGSVASRSIFIAFAAWKGSRIFLLYLWGPDPVWFVSALGCVFSRLG